jgi:S1-C subfamily serine protease
VLGRYEEALYLLDRVREAMPKDATTVYLRARAISELGDLDRALTSYQEALKLDPAFAAAHVQRAVVLRYLQRVEEASKDEQAAFALLGDALKQDPVNAFAMRQRARLFWDLGRFDEALADWERVVERDDRDVFGLGNLALLLAAHPDAKKRDGRKALALATKLTELTLGKGAFWLSVRAAAHAETGDFDAARNWQQDAIAVCPHVEYGEYAERLALYERRKPYRLSAEETDPTKSLAEVVLPPHVPAKTFEALQPAEATKQPPAQIAGQRPAIVLVKSDEGFGTGMILDQQGYVLTCAHVLPYSGPITVHYDDGEERREAEGLAVAVNYRRDLALLKFQPADGASLRTVRLGIEKGKPTKVMAGSLAVVIGNPGDRQWVLDKVVLNGSISSERQLLGDHVKQPYVQVEANVSEGCSGGPLFDDHGRVVGVVARKSGDIQRTGYAIPMDVVARFLNVH